MATDLHQLSIEQLQDLIDRAQSRIKTARKEDLVEARKQISAVLAQHGVTLDEVFPTRGDRTPAAARPPRPPKYQNPANPAEVWSGMGRPPRWVAEALKHRGTTLEQFLIKAPGKVTKRARASASA